MAEKKIVLFIVEGINDEKEVMAAIHTPFFSHFHEHYVPYVKTVNGDITADRLSNEKNIKERIGKIVRTFRKEGVPFRDIKTSDIHKIIHIVDIDGVFIPRESIIQSDDVKYVYRSDCILATNPDVVYGRNRKKAKNLCILAETETIDNISYECYFVSCNMDHIISGKVNCQQFEKSELARAFIVNCKNNPKCIFDAFFKEGIAYTDSYKESWSAIQQGTNSLNRHTNLNLYLSSIMNEEYAKE